MNAVRLVTVFSMMFVTSPALCMRPSAATGAITPADSRAEFISEGPRRMCCSIRTLRMIKLEIAKTALSGSKKYESARYQTPTLAAPPFAAIFDADAAALTAFLAENPKVRERISNNTAFKEDDALLFAWMKVHIGQCDHAADDAKANADAKAAATPPGGPAIAAE